MAAQPVIAVMMFLKPNTSNASVIALMARDFPAPGKRSVVVFSEFYFFV